MSTIYSEDTYYLSQCLKKIVLKSHLKAPNMQQLKKKKKGNKTNKNNTTTLKSATYFERGLDGLLWHE